MRLLAAIERHIERLVERSTARVFRSRLRPAAIEREIARAMERGRRHVGGTTVVPDRFVVRMNPVDLAGLAREHNLDILTGELARSAHDIARRRGDRLAGRPAVELRPDDGRESGDPAIDAVISSPEPTPIDVANGGDAGRSFSDRTIVMVVPPIVTLHLVDGASAVTVPFVGRPVSIGRADDNDLVATGPAVSRHHARIHRRGGALVIVDLDSRNGVVVNGVRVSEAVLGIGDRIGIGGATIVVEPPGPADGPA